MRRGMNTQPCDPCGGWTPGSLFRSGTWGGMLHFRDSLCRHSTVRYGPASGGPMWGDPVMAERPVNADRFVAIHSHFYQPPRENPWLEAVEIQDSAAPYHDWNERVTAECYAPNTAARRVAEDNRILDIVNNFEKISFNVGPTLLAWLERHTPDAYRNILQADSRSRNARNGHGNAIAQIYNHMILPLA